MMGVWMLMRVGMGMGVGMSLRVRVVVGVLIGRRGMRMMCVGIYRRWRPL